MNERIKLTDSTQSAIVKLCEGNPGALSVCLEVLTRGAQIDPQAMMGGLAGLLALDTLGIYGSKIWMLYKDVCGQDLVKTLAVLRSWQLGHTSKQRVDHAISNYGDGLDLDAILLAVQETLPEFGQELGEEEVTVA